MMGWVRGRQQTHYDKKVLLWSNKFRFDVHILRFPEGSYIASHVDKVDGHKHYRLNIILKNAESGGEFICKNPIFDWWRIKLFRSDVSEHSVTKVEKGTRYILSFGWAQ